MILCFWVILIKTEKDKLDQWTPPHPSKQSKQTFPFSRFHMKLGGRFWCTVTGLDAWVDTQIQSQLRQNCHCYPPPGVFAGLHSIIHAVPPGCLSRNISLSRKPSLHRSAFVPSAPLCHRLTVLGLFMSSAPGVQRLLGMKSRQVGFFFSSRHGAKQIAGEWKAKLHLLPFPVSK